MNTSQAFDYLDTTKSIPVRDMSKAMFKLLRGCAKIMQFHFPAMSGFYDPESTDTRINLQKHLFCPALRESVIPQSETLIKKLHKQMDDPFGNSFELFSLIEKSPSSNDQ